MAQEGSKVPTQAGADLSASGILAAEGAAQQPARPMPLVTAESTRSTSSMTNSSSGSLSVASPSPFAASAIPFGDSSSESEEEEAVELSHEGPDPVQAEEGLTFSTQAQDLERVATPPLPGTISAANKALGKGASAPAEYSGLSIALEAQAQAAALPAGSPFSQVQGPAFEPAPVPPAEDAPAAPGSLSPRSAEAQAYATCRAGSLVAGPPTAKSPRVSGDSNAPLTVKEMARRQAEQAIKRDSPKISSQLQDSPIVEMGLGEASSAPYSIQRNALYNQAQQEQRSISAPISTPLRGSLSGLARPGGYGGGRRGGAKGGPMGPAAGGRSPVSAARQQSRTISQMLVDGVIADEGMHIEGEAPLHSSGTVLDLKLLSRRNCPSLHTGDPPATVAAAVGSLVHVRLDNERLTDLGRGLLERLTAAISLTLANNLLTSASNLGVLPSLRVLDLSRNQLSQVHGLRSLSQLMALDLSKNKLQSVEVGSLPLTLRFLQVAGNPVSEAQPKLAQALAAAMPMLRLVDGVALPPVRQTTQAADPVLDQLDIAAAAKSPSGGAVGFRRPPISPSRGSGKRLLDAANPPQDAASTSSPPSTPTRQSQPEPSPFPERFDGSLPCSARLAAAVRYLASMPVRSKPPHAAPPPRPGARSHPVPQPWPAALAARQQLLDLLPQPLGLADDASHEAPDALTRQLETYLKLGSRQDEPASPAGGAQLPVFNPLMTAAVIRARMALAGAVPKMLAAARDSKLAAMAASAPPQSAMQASLHEHTAVKERLALRAGEGDFLVTHTRLPSPAEVLASVEALTGPTPRASSLGQGTLIPGRSPA